MSSIKLSLTIIAMVALFVSCSDARQRSCVIATKCTCNSDSLGNFCGFRNETLPGTDVDDSDIKFHYLSGPCSPLGVYHCNGETGTLASRVAVCATKCYTPQNPGKDGCQGAYINGKIPKLH